MRSLEMLNFCESGEFSTTLSSFQESPDKMILDFYSFPNLPISHHLSAELTGCNSLPSVGHV